MRFNLMFDGKVIYSCLTNHSMCIEELMDMAGTWVEYGEEGYSDEGDNLVINGVRYYYEDLNMVLAD